MLLSIAMMIKNESKYLEECLKSLEPVRDNIECELIIVDTGSTDNSVEIAKKYTDKVYIHEWKDNFSQMRNITVEYSIGEWFFYIDGDEIIGDAQGIIEFFTQGQYKNFNSACINITNFHDSKEKDSSVFLAARLFKKDKDFHFEGAVHNQPLTKQPIAKLKGVIFHYGYISDDEELMERKFKRTSMILKQELDKEPDHIYYRHQLAVTYSMHKDYRQSLEESFRAYETLNRKGYDKSLYVYVHNQLIKGLIREQRYLEAEKIALEAIQLDKENVDVYIWLAKIQFVNKDYEKARENYEKYLYYLKENQRLTVKNLAIITYTLDKYEVAYIDLFEIYYHYKNYNKCMELVFQINKEDFYDKNFEKVVDCFITNEKYEKLWDFCQSKSILSNEFLLKTFISSIENRIKVLNEEEKFKIYVYFAKSEGKYGVLNKIRLLFHGKKYEEADEKIRDFLKDEDLSMGMDILGDIFYILICMNKPVCKYFFNISERNISIYLDFAKDYHHDYFNKVFEYVINQKLREEFKFIKAHKILSRSLLSFEVKEGQYLECFKRYVDYGIRYISTLYNEESLLNEYIYDVKNDEEVFLLYMYKAEMYKNSDIKEYIQNLKKALQKVPMFKRGIECLYRELEDLINEPTEMDILKSQLKVSIRGMIDNRMISEAEDLINQYEEMVSDDMDILLFKSQISLIKVEGYQNILPQ